MEMHEIKYFLVLAEELNFTRAAERCNVSQPSITRAIKMLELELGGPLFPSRTVEYSSVRAGAHDEALSGASV